MTRSRSWNLRLNLDLFNSAYARLFDASDHSDYLNGLYRGMNQGKVPPVCSDAMAAGFELGSEMRAEAENYITKASESGRKSAERKSNKIEAPYQGPHQGAPQGTFNQSTIHNLQSTNQKPKRARKPQKETTHIPEDLLPSLQRLCKEWPSQSLGQPGPGGSQKKQDLAKWTDPVDLWERWREWWPDTEPTLLAECGLAYLDGLEYIEDEWSPKKYPKFCYAMRNFYGQQAYWKLLKGKAITRIANAIR